MGGNAARLGRGSTVTSPPYATARLRARALSARPPLHAPLSLCVSRARIADSIHGHATHAAARSVPAHIPSSAHTDCDTIILSSLWGAEHLNGWKERSGRFPWKTGVSHTTWEGSAGTSLKMQARPSGKRCDSGVCSCIFYSSALRTRWTPPMKELNKRLQATARRNAPTLPRTQSSVGS